ncbi:hypothetical protein [Erythrobacter sp. F6033]|uniref:hypothetical protein n=1 Tax=Erythrobacter sp. F6033 TaxID=2926401 RepID=UPI001FF39A9D|nr:hypothetical protein [Erythrobacter sp. F6033]MCK0129266.1 hypothetical protein [Erythrobacter sp. F6033]
MTLARTLLKTAAIGAALMTSTSAFAQWQGTWEINGTRTGLIQSGDYVTGQMVSGDIIQGVLSPDKKVLRGVHKKSGRKYTIELKLSAANKFRGGVFQIANGYPINPQLAMRWNGTATRQTSAGAAREAAKQSFLNEQSSAVRNWINGVENMRGSSVAVAAPASQSANAAVQQAPATVDTGVQGTWNITIKGTQYGPFESRNQAFAFSTPDRNGVVTGTSIGRNNVIFIGRVQSGSNRKLHGIWMEAKRGVATGRWGLMEVRTSGEPATAMQARFSIGYRKPSGAWVGRAPGQPGMVGSGPKLHSNPIRLLGVSQAQAQWRNLLAKKSPFPAIHGLWPTREIDAAIQPWIRGETEVARFGGTQLVDPCVAKCMGKEPQQLTLFGANIEGRKNRERVLEFSGFVNTSASLLQNGKAIRLPANGSTKIFDRTRENAVKFNDKGRGDIDLFVSPPRQIEMFCDRNTNFRLGRAGFPLPEAAWSDPLTEIRISYSGSVIEWGAIRNATRRLTPRKSANFDWSQIDFTPYGWHRDFKKQWSELNRFVSKYEIDPEKLNDEIPCYRTEAAFAEPNGKRDLTFYLRTDVQVR